MTKKEIMKALHNIEKQLKNEGFNVLAVFLQGSQNYNLASYTKEYMSDIDAKAFILPSFKDLYNNKLYSKVYETEYGQVEVKDIRKFAELIKKSNPSYIELLFTEYAVINDKGFKYIQSLCQDVVNDRKAVIMRAAYGMLTQKKKALTHPYEGLKDTIEKYGYDPKQLHHLIRLYYLVRDLSNDVPYSEVLRPKGIEHDYLMELKVKAMPLEDALALSEEYDLKTREIVDAEPIEGQIKSDSVNKIYDAVVSIVETKTTWSLIRKKFGLK